MRAWACVAPGGPETLARLEIERPQAGRGHVVVRVSHTSVNPIDCKLRRGALRPLLPRRYPAVLGFDVVGTVEQVGPGAELRAGDEVFGLVDLWRPGACAEAIRMPEAHLWRRPPWLSRVHAGVLPLAGLTAHDAVVRAGRVSAGDRVLIAGAAGGVGLLAVQIAHARGAHVTTLTAPGNAGLMRDLGADEILARGAGAWPQQRCDVLLDLTGGTEVPRLLSRLRPGGRFVTTLGRPRSGWSVLSALLRAALPMPLLKPSRGGMNDLLSLIERGQVRIRVADELPLDDLPEAHRRIESQTTVGKLAIAVGG